jgi:hypothetical protein
MDAPSGTLVAFAAQPGAEAADGTGRNGLYTKHLLDHIRQEGLTVEQMFKRVREKVERESGNKQSPREESSLKGEDFYFRAPKGGTQVATLVPVPATAPVATSAAQTDADTALWNAVEKGGSGDDYNVYLKQYPKGKYAALAKQRQQKLKDEARQQSESAEKSAWQVAESGGKTEVDAYLANYPKGRYASVANLRLAQIKKEDEIERKKHEKSTASQSVHSAPSSPPVTSSPSTGGASYTQADYKQQVKKIADVQSILDSVVGYITSVNFKDFAQVVAMVDDASDQLSKAKEAKSKHEDAASRNDWKNATIWAEMVFRYQVKTADVLLRAKTYLEQNGAKKV